MDATPSGPSFAPASTALGVPFMDAEHECLFGMYDELTRAVTSGASTKFFAERFSFLTPYAADHFSHEEFVMRKFEYSRYFEHRSQHERMLHDSEDFLRFVGEYYEPDECYALARLLSLWLKHHVDKYDRLLAHFIRWQTQNVSTLRQLPILPPFGLKVATSHRSDVQQAKLQIRSREIRRSRSPSLKQLGRFLLPTPCSARRQR